MIKNTLVTIKGFLTVTIPSSINELQLGQLSALQEETDLSDIKAISILSGIPVQDLKQVKNYHDFSAFNQTVNNLSYQIRCLYKLTNIPSKLIVCNKKGQKVKVKIPKDLSFEPAGAFMSARDIITEEIAAHIKANGEEQWQDDFNPSLTSCCALLAHYLYTRTTGLDYDEQAATEFTTQINMLPVTDALPIARHFFLNYSNSLTRKTGFWQHLHQLWRSGLAYITLRSSSILIQ